jgi:hypothetical protein
MHGCSPWCRQSAPAQQVLRRPGRGQLTNLFSKPKPGPLSFQPAPDPQQTPFTQHPLQRSLRIGTQQPQRVAIHIDAVLRNIKPLAVTLQGINLIKMLRICQISKRRLLHGNSDLGYNCICTQIYGLFHNNHLPFRLSDYPTFRPSTFDL